MMMAIVAVAAISCYDEQEGNDFDTLLPDVEIVIPNTSYSGSLGQVITIDPQVKTEIPDSDLDYYWEVSGARNNESGKEFYAPLVNDDEQGKTLTYTCKLDSNITSLNKSYKCRLRAHQKSTGRDFYSADNFTITISRHHRPDGTIFRGIGQRRWSAYGRRVHAKGKFAARETKCYQCTLFVCKWQ